MWDWRSKSVRQRIQAGNENVILRRCPLRLLVVGDNPKYKLGGCARGAPKLQNANSRRRREWR